MLTQEEIMNWEDDVANRLEEREREADSHLLFDDVHGIYVPQRFATEVHPDKVRGVDKAHRIILGAGPYHEEYWDVWDYVLANVRVVLSPERVFRLEEREGCVWLVPTKD